MSDLAMEFGKYNKCHDARGKFCSGSTYSRIQAVKDLAAKDPRVAEAEKLNREGGDSRNWPGVQKDGHYTLKAHAENISIAESFLNPAAKAKEGEAPIAIILLGKPGAGKTTVVKSMGTTTQTTMINSDDIKEKIPGHKPNAAQVTHERSCDIARNYLAPAAVAARHNITFDMTDNQERVLKMATELKAKGYKIGVIHVDVDNATSAERVYSRFQHTGRYVPVSVALSYGDKPEKSYQALKSSGLADQWRKYDNSSYGKPPKQLDAGGKDVFKRGAVGGLGAGFGGGSDGDQPALGEGDGRSFEQEDQGFEKDVAKAGDGIMIAWFPPAELADKLAQEGGEKPEELRVTLAYLGKQEAFTDDQVELLKDTVEKYCSQYAPLQGTLGGNGRFPATPSSDDKDVLIKMVDVALLEKFREELIEELADKGIPIVRNHGYTPHMTLAYVDSSWKGECTHPDTEDIVIDALTVAIGGERHVYPLNGEEVLKSNECHVPSGPAGGQFCSGGSGGDSKAIPRLMDNYRGIGAVSFAPQGSTDTAMIEENKQVVDAVLDVVPESVSRGLQTLYVTGGGSFLGSATYIPKDPRPGYASDGIMLMDGFLGKSPSDKRMMLAHEFGHRAQLTTHPKVFKEFEQKNLASMDQLKTIFPDHWQSYLKDRPSAARSKRISGEVFADSFGKHVLGVPQATPGLTSFWEGRKL